MTINLLPWRRYKGWFCLRNEILIFCCFIGCLALLLEIGLALMTGVKEYLQYQSQQIMKQYIHYEKQAQAVSKKNNAIGTAQQQITAQKKAELSWLNNWQKTNLIAKATPADIAWHNLSWNNRSEWHLQGTSNGLKTLDLFQKNILAKGFDSELIDWQPTLDTSTTQAFVLKIIVKP